MFFHKKKRPTKPIFHLKRKEIFIAKILLNRKVLRNITMYVCGKYLDKTNEYPATCIYNKLDKRVIFILKTNLALLLFLTEPRPVGIFTFGKTHDIA